MLTGAATLESGLFKPGAATAQVPALDLLLSELAASNYRFITPTPVTHQRVLARATQASRSLRDIFGWNRPFTASDVRPQLLDIMAAAGVLHAAGDLLSSTVRVSSIGDDLFVHSAFPTVQENAVFFGPDTYRFARFIQQGLEPAGAAPGTQANWATAVFGRELHPLRVLDVGCGSGAGGIVAARCIRHAGIPVTVTMNDINPLALRYTSVNATFAGIPVELAHGDALSAVSGEFDLVISNPPYLDDAAARAYRHGGARLGRALSVRIALEALQRLAPGGQLLLYTGVAIVDGVDPFIAELLPHLERAGCDFTYSEIDPDVFGEELERPVYAHADRIAAVGLTARCPLTAG
ncbi:MAG: class I SAM-dependent methyltransferase [Pseudomonadota bacterium]